MKKNDKIIALTKLIELINSKRFGTCKTLRSPILDGLCGAVRYLYITTEITTEQYNFILNLILHLTPMLKGNYPGYVWTPGLKQPRIEWLQTQIEIIQKKSKKKGKK